MPNREPSILKPSTGGERALALVVARESTQYDQLLMEGMIGQTVSQVLHLPGAADVLAAGIAPLNGEGPFDTYQYRKNGTHICLFEHQDVVYLYCTGSAAKMNTADGENEFIQFLCSTLNAYEPVTTNTVSISRMMRALEVAGPLYKTLSMRTDAVVIGNLSMDLRTAHGKALWTVLAMIADTERADIVKRLFAGLVFRYLQGCYIFGAEALPPGYQLGDDGVVVLDDDAVPGVRVLLEAMANPTLTARQVIDIAGAAGVTTPTTRRLHGEGATFADLCRADSRVASLIDWLPTYATGRTEICHQNPYTGATQFHSLVVEGATRSDPGFVRFTFDWPVPDGGWCDPDLLTAAAARTTGRKQRRSGGGAHRRRKPLAGWVSWRDAESEYRLSGTSSHYIVLRRTAVGMGENRP